MIGPLTNLREQIERLREERHDDQTFDGEMEEAELSFTIGILEACFPFRFRMTEGAPYEGVIDPTDHIETFRT